VTPLKRAARNVFWKALPSPVERVARFFLFIVAARVLGSARFGTYQFAATTAALLGSVTELGIGTWTTRALARDAASAGRVIATGVRVRLAGALVYSAALLGLCFLEEARRDRIAFVLIGLATLGGSLVDYVGAILRGYQEFAREAWTSLARAVLTTTAALGALALSGAVVDLATGLLIGSVASVAVAVREVRARDRGGGDFAGALIPWSDMGLVPLWLAGLFSVLYFRCDVVLLHALTNDTEVGHYGAAYRVFEATTLAPAAIMAVAFPRLSQQHTEHAAAGAAALERKLAALVGGLGVGTGVLLYSSSDWVVKRAFGYDFTPAAESLRILAFAAPPLFLNFALSAFLFARMRERRYVVLSGALVVFNVLANLAAIPRWGAHGAAGVTVLSELALVVGSLVALRSSDGPR
jgi:O-antigen/teichoic acid export membrane protein